MVQIDADDLIYPAQMRRPAEIDLVATDEDTVTKVTSTAIEDTVQRAGQFW